MKSESYFIPITAIVGGLFGVNVELTVEGRNYYIMNEHYNGRWAPGVIHCSHSVWSVAAYSNITSMVSREQATSDCYHTGTLAAYMRLNDLKVSQVLSDGHCGFHTVAVLCGLTSTGKCDEDLRKTLVNKTADYVISNKNAHEAYLGSIKMNTVDQLKSLLMTHKRWLTVDEVCMMLRANGKQPAMISEATYPIYNSDFSHFLYKCSHYEPVM